LFSGLSFGSGFDFVLALALGLGTLSPLSCFLALEFFQEVGNQ
jgi:hypothetical protein